MRCCWLLLLILSLLPDSFGWRGAKGADSCCEQECRCSHGSRPSCCESGAGPRVVATCDCGGGHEQHFVGVRFDRAPLESLRVPVLGGGTSWVVEPAGETPARRTLAPELPPPRQA